MLTVERVDSTVSFGIRRQGGRRWPFVFPYREEPLMTDARLSAGYSSSRSILRLGAVAGIWACLLVPSDAFAQAAKGKKAPEAEKITGKVTEVEHKGKAVTLMIEKDAGGTLEV